MARLAALVAQAARTLAAAGVPSPEYDARELAAHALGLDRLPVTVDDAPEGFEARYGELIKARASRIPLQHLTGVAHFRYLTLGVGPGVFVPRPETEVVAQVAIDRAFELSANGPVTVVDLCTGSGAIALAVASEVPGSRVIAVELSREAFEAATDNARRTGISVEMRQGDAGDPAVTADLVGAIDIVVSNPPYIPSEAVPIDPEVREHDPHMALYGGGADGLAIPSAVIHVAQGLLKSGGLLVMEHANTQGEAARAIASASGAWRDIRTAPDLTGRDRMLVATRA